MNPDFELLQFGQWANGRRLVELSGKLYQCDGILSDGSQCYLLEVKFFEKRPASVRDIQPQRREQAAKDLDCPGIVCVSLNGFDDSVRE